MTPAMLDKRLAALEVKRSAAPVHYTPEERTVLAQRYAESLADPGEPDPRALAYWSSASLMQIAADYADMIGGCPAPWE